MINIGTSTINAVKLGTTNISAVYIGTTQIYPAASAYSGFYIEDASGSANTVSITKNDANAPTLTIETSTDGTTWTTLGTTSTTALNISVPANGKVYVRCNANAWSDGTNYNAVSSTGDFNVGGNVMSLLYGSNFDGTETSFPSGSAYNFKYLFYNATHLVNASGLTLPATTLTTSCYHYMFRGCSSLTTAPALPATTLASTCYSSMFYECTSLTAAPALNATTLTYSCYNYMFYGCTSLTTAPTLPAPTLAERCYRAMFAGCTALTTAPALPVTTLQNNCYQRMFQGCSSLTTAPVLPAPTLVSACYQYMFENCTSLNSITCLATDISATDCTADWVTNVAASGVFAKDSSMTSWTIGNNGIPTGWTAVDYVDYTECFYVEDVSGSANAISLSKRGSSAPTLTIETSTDGQTWSTLGQTSTTALQIQVPANGKVYVRCNANTWFANSASNVFATATGNFKVGGNVMSLIYGSNFTGNETSFPSGSRTNLASLFWSNSYLTDASALLLPATTLTNFCYQNMFVFCTSLVTPPALNATTLADACYSGMFQNCSSLTTTPALSVTTLAPYCYGDMFKSCTSLTIAPTLPATTLATYCYRDMFQGCTALTAAPALPATTLATGCYDSMFNGCTSLTTAPELPVTTLAEGCYASMFLGCTSLTTAPELNASILVTDCYYRMFYNCTSLNAITCLATDISASDCTTNWVYNVAATGTFTKSPTMSSWTTGDNGIPTGWLTENYMDWFYVEDASGAANTVSIEKSSANAPTLTIETSPDKTTWTTLGTTDTTPLDISVPAGGKVYVRCVSTGTTNASYYNSFSTATGDFNVGGNVMSLFYGSSFDGTETAFPTGTTNPCRRMFNNNTSLVSAYNLKLPATTLVDYCYGYMFFGCTSLTTAPVTLPADTLMANCYRSMFQGCTALTSAPVLPALTLAANCYSLMFQDCTSLTTAPTLPATTLAESCYSSMFLNCTSLTTAPVLLADTLVKQCYQSMFRGCSNLTEMTVYFYIWPNFSSSSSATYRATYQWTQGLPSSGTFYGHPITWEFNAPGNATVGNTVANCTNAVPYRWMTQLPPAP